MPMPEARQAAPRGPAVAARLKESVRQARALLKASARAPDDGATPCAAPLVTLLGAGATNYTGGMGALRDLPSLLSSDQADALRALAAARYSRSSGLSPLEFNGVKNAAADILLQQPGFPAGFLADLALQHADPAQDEVWRDYCLQMLASGHLALAGRAASPCRGAAVGASSDPDVAAARELALVTLMAAASSGGGTWPGTALLGLSAILAAEPAAFPRAELDNRILGVLSDASASEAALITAARLAGAGRLTSARQALETLKRSSVSGLVRDAAAASLAEMPPETP